jgi:hypothetical protein|tara:strand:- start:618 stop:797 length:180 start_codon:yes stop_codon:yes gene_type:complete
MSQIFQFQIGLEWFRQSNKYLENLIQISTSDYGNVTVNKEEKDKSFEKEFDYIIRNMGL